MRKFLMIFSALSIITLRGQNLQLHYDFGSDRHFVTTTLEMFHPDPCGATFWFVDFDYDDDSGEPSASMAYWELARYQKIPFLENRSPWCNLSATIQYNDGLNTTSGFGNVWLAGFSYLLNLGIITLNTDLLWRKAEQQNSHFQLTLVWYEQFLKGKISFAGFFDLWSQCNFDGDAQATDFQWVWMTEPQLWFNLNAHFALGGELEISRNFIFAAGDGWQFMPTLGLKWEF